MTPQSTSMRRAGGILCATGVLFALLALPPLQPIAHLFLKIAYWPVHEVDAVARMPVPQPLLLAICGGLTAGLGGMLWALASHVVPLSPKAAAQVARTAGWTWFCTDSAASVMVGAPVNVALNLVFLGVILLSSRPVPAEAEDSRHETGRAD